MAETAEIRFGPWPGGLNLQSHPGQVEPDELLEAKNVQYGPKGEIVSRPDVVTETPFPTTTDYHLRFLNWPVKGTEFSKSASVTWRHVFIVSKFNGSNYDILLAGKSYADAWEELTVLAGVDDAPDHLLHMNGEGFLTILNLTDIKRIIPATGAAPTISTITRWLPNTDGNTTTKMPRALDYEVAYERVFAVNINTTGDLGKSEGYFGTARMYFSEPLLPLTWKTTNFIDINPDDRQEITAIKYFADQLIIFKEGSIWSLYGTDFEGLELRLTVLDKSVGATKRTVEFVAPGLLVWFDQTQGIFAFDGQDVHSIGDKVWDWIEANQDGNVQLDYGAWAWAIDHRYYLMVPVTGGTKRVFVWDAKLQAWSWWDEVIWAQGFDMQIVQKIPQPKVAVLVGGNTGIRILDPDAATAMTVRTGWIEGKLGGSLNRFQNLSALLGNGGDVTVKIFTEFDTDSPKATISSAVTPENDGFRWHLPGEGNVRWRAASIQIETKSGETVPPKISELLGEVSVLERVRN